MAIEFTLNGCTTVVNLDDSHETLLQYLRRQGLTGSKEGCAEGECGACAVILIQADGEKARYQAVNSCLLLLASLHQREVLTVEGLHEGTHLHPTQQVMVSHGGSQCGYCTPGFIMTMAAEYYRKGRGDFEVEALNGNLCRCTGYRPIRDAALSLGMPLATDPLAERLDQPVPVLTYVSQQDTQHKLFLRPVNLPELWQLLETYPSAKLVAGGTDWLVEVNQSYARREVQIAIDAIAELKELTWNEGYVDIGAGLCLSDIEHQLGASIPLLGRLFPLFASPLIRHRATLGGNLATASPIGDAAPVLLALDAKLILASQTTERELALKDFFIAYRQNALRAKEIIKSIRIPLPVANHSSFYKFAKRRADDISAVAAAFAFDIEDNIIKAAKLAFGGVAASPMRAYQTEELLRGQAWNETTLALAQAQLRHEFKPISDVRSSAAYRQAMIVNSLAAFFDDMKAGKL